MKNKRINYLLKYPEYLSAVRAITGFDYDYTKPIKTPDKVWFPVYCDGDDESDCYKKLKKTGVLHKWFYVVQLKFDTGDSVFIKKPPENVEDIIVDIKHDDNGVNHYKLQRNYWAPEDFIDDCIKPEHNIIEPPIKYNVHDKVELCIPSDVNDPFSAYSIKEEKFITYIKENPIETSIISSKGIYINSIISSKQLHLDENPARYYEIKDCPGILIRGTYLKKIEWNPKFNKGDTVEIKKDIDLSEIFGKFKKRESHLRYLRSQLKRIRENSKIIVKDVKRVDGKYYYSIQCNLLSEPNCLSYTLTLEMVPEKCLEHQTFENQKTHTTLSPGEYEYFITGCDFHPLYDIKYDLIK